ncbi:MAG: hypothetical protein AAB224_08800 [Gemmatimonadota bacterium]
MQMSVRQYDALERAITDGCRISVFRRGTEFLVIPERLVLRNRRECIEARHPTTGDHLTLWIDEADAVEIVR